MAQLQKIIMLRNGSTATTYHALKLISVGIGYLLNDSFNINGKGISEDPSCLKLKLPENILHSTEPVSS